MIPPNQQGIAMRRIIYRSVASPELDKAEIFRLVFQARTSNEERGLSGFLVHIDNRFFQVLEGSTWKLVAAFETIRRDLRHSQVEVIDERSLPVASFESWRMRYFDGRNVLRMMAQIEERAGGQIPQIVYDSLIDFLGRDLLSGVTPAARPINMAAVLAPPQAGQPSTPRAC